MSERMREPFHTLMWKASIGYNDSWSQVDPEVLEKFAELIVQETIKQMAIQMDKFGDDQSNNPAWYKSEETVKKHFGVKDE